MITRPLRRTMGGTIRVRGRAYPARLEKVGSRLTAFVDVPIPNGGTLTLSASVDERDIRSIMERYAVKHWFRELQDFVATGDDLAVGDAWKDFSEFFTKTIPKETNKVAKSKVFADVAKGISTVTDHPAYNVAMAAVNVIPGYGQAISAGMAGMKVAAAGMNLLARAKSGEPQAQESIKALNQAAKQGDPQAQKAMGTLTALNSAPQYQTGAPVPIDMAVVNATTQMAEAFMPELANQPAYQAMKAGYGTVRGIVDMAAGDDGVYRPVPRYRYGLPPP